MRALAHGAALALVLLGSVVPAVQAGAAGLLINEADAAEQQESEAKSAKPAQGKESAPAPRDERKGARVGDDLDTCRRDADGMRGPERSRFMTQCLKERR